MSRGRILIQGAVYRLVTAQDPAVEGGEEPTVDEVAFRMDSLKTQMEDELAKADITASEPLFATTQEGFRLVAETSPVGALEGTAGALTFDYGVGWVYDITNENALADKLGIDEYWQRVLSLSGWKDTALTLVEWSWCGMRFVADTNKIMKGLLTSVSLLQRVNAKTEQLNLEPEGEDPEVYKDWALTQAVNMIRHGLGAEGYSEVKQIKNILNYMVDRGRLDVFEQNLVLKILQTLPGGTDDTRVEVDRLKKAMEDNPELSSGRVDQIMEAVLRARREPSDYLLRDKFLKVVETASGGDDQLVSQIKQALDRFESDEEWANALKERLETKGGPTTTKERVLNTLNQLVGGIFDVNEGSVNMAVTEEGEIVAQLSAPFPFYYVFRHDAGNLALIEAAMQICDRVVYVNEGDGNLDLHADLLRTDGFLAYSYGIAAGQEDSKKSTQPQESRELAHDLLRLIEEKQQAANA